MERRRTSARTASRREGAGGQDTDGATGSGHGGSGEGLTAADAAASAQQVSALLAMNVSPFLYKTYQIVIDPSTDHIISWNSDGTTFIVHRPDLVRKIIYNLS